MPFFHSLQIWLSLQQESLYLVTLVTKNYFWLRMKLQLTFVGSRPRIQVRCTDQTLRLINVVGIQRAGSSEVL